MKRKIEVSVRSMLPWSLGQNGLMRSIAIARKAGFFYLQTMPFRGWNKQSFIDYSKGWIASYEEAYSCGDFPSAIYRKILYLFFRLSGFPLNKRIEEYPLLRDWFLFGTKSNSEEKLRLFQKHFREAIRISHDTDARVSTILELSPEIMTPELRDVLINKTELLNGMAWDPEDLVRLGKYGEPPVVTNWRDLLTKLEPEQIKLIYIKTHHQIRSISEVEYIEMLISLSLKTKDTRCPIVFEGKPPLSAMLSRQKMVTWLKEEREFLKPFFG